MSETATAPAGDAASGLTTESISSMDPGQAETMIRQLQSDSGFRAKITGPSMFGAGAHEREIWNSLHAQAHGKGAKAYAEAQQQSAPVSDNLAQDERVPATPEQYYYQLPQGMQEALGGNAEALAQTDREIREWASAIGASNKDIGHLLALLQTEVKLGLSEDRIDAAGHRAEMRLKAEWGPEFDTRLERTNKFLREEGGKPFTEFLTRSGLGNNEGAIRKMFELAERAGY